MDQSHQSIKLIKLNIIKPIKSKEYQSINQSNHQPINRSIDQWNRSTDQSIKHINQSNPSLQTHRTNRIKINSKSSLPLHSLAFVWKTPQLLRSTRHRCCCERAPPVTAPATRTYDSRATCYHDAYMLCSIILYLFMSIIYCCMYLFHVHLYTFSPPPERGEVSRRSGTLLRYW